MASAVTCICFTRPAITQDATPTLLVKLTSKHGRVDFAARLVRCLQRQLRLFQPAALDVSAKRSKPLRLQARGKCAAKHALIHKMSRTGICTVGAADYTYMCDSSL